jgi:Leucine-rich repeat (LRR) protein
MIRTFTLFRLAVCLLLTCCVLSTYAQTVNIPDANFKSALIANHAINTNGDSEIQVSEAEAFTGTMRVSNKSISDLTGIESFTSLTALWCDNNNLTSLNVSSNTALTTLRCDHNAITKLDVSNNTRLTDLRCYVNQIASLDVSANTMLSVLLVFQNKLTALDVSTNTALTQLQASFNQLTTLDVSGNHQLTNLDVRKNYLMMLNVKNGNNTSFVNFDARQNPQLYCIEVDDAAWAEANWTQVDAGAYFSTDCAGSQNDIVYIPDQNFKSILLAYGPINTNNDREIQVAEAANYTGAIKVAGKDISDLTGIEAFTNITVLECHSNNLTSLDVSKNTKLTYLRCDHNSISSLDVSSNTLLRELLCYYNQLTALNVSANTALNNLMCFGNKITSLDVSANTQLINLQTQHNQLTSLTIGNKTNLTTLYTDANKLTSLDITGAPAIVNLRVNLNKLTSLDLTHNTQVEMVIAGDNLLTSLDLRNNVKLNSLRVYNNKLTTLNLRTNINLTDFFAEKNPFTSLDVRSGHNTTLAYFNTMNTPQLFCIEVDDPAWSQEHWPLVDPASHFSEDCNPSDNVVYIPDVNFKNYLVGRPEINTNGDDEIQVTEAHAYNDFINVGSKNISDLTGIEAFTAITFLFAGDNHLTKLDLSANTALTQADVSVNDLTSFILGDNASLSTVVCSDNQLPSLDVSGLPSLKNLEVDENHLTKIDVSQNPLLEYLGATINQITEIDVSANTHLRGLGVTNNHLTYLNMKNGHNSSMLGFAAKQNPDLHCIEVDDVAYAQANWSDDVDPGVTFSTDCDYPQDNVVYIPDPNFKQRVLMDTDINTNGDDEIQVSEAEAFTGFLNLDATGVADQTGLEAFINIEALDIQHSNMTSLDLSANTALKYVDCGQNQITTLKINPGLETLYCYYNQISSIDLNGNTHLMYFDATDNNLTSLDLGALDTTVLVLSIAQNPITSIDLSGLSNLEVIGAYETQLTSLDLNAFPKLSSVYVWDNPEMTSIKVRNGNNINMDFSATNSPKLRCIEVDNVAYAEQYFAKDDTAWFSENCGNAGGDVVYFADPNLKSFLVSLPDVNSNHDTEIQVSEAEYGGSAGSNWNTLFIENKDIHDATGMEAFVNLRYLIMNNNHLTTIDVRQMTGLKGIQLTDNDLTSVQFGNGLESLVVDSNELTDLDLSNASGLLTLHFANNPMGPLDVSHLTNLRDLDCSGTGISSLDVSANINLTSLLCASNQLTNVDVSTLTNLAYLGVNNNQLSSVNLSNNLQLQWMNCSDNPITALNVNHLTHLYGIVVNNTPITSLDLSNLHELEDVNVEHNQLTSLTTAGSWNLVYLHAGFNQLTSFTPGGVLDVLELNDNRLTSLDLGGYEGHDYYFWNMHNNPDLHCVDVIDVEFAQTNWSDFFDEGVSFSTDCGGADPAGRMTISMYPNPVVDKVNIDSTEPVDLVQVFDSTGGLLIDTQKGNTIDFSSFRRGVYLMHVYSGGKRTPVRVVKE